MPISEKVTFVREDSRTGISQTQTVTPPLPQTREDDGDPVLIRRGAVFDFDIEIGDESFKERDFKRFVTGIEVELHEDKADLVKVQIRNEDFRLENEAIFSEGKTLKITAGYPQIDKGVELARFVVTRPRFSFDTNRAIIELTGLGEEILLSETEQRRLWTNVTDSEIAETIAPEYGLKAEVEKTNLRHERLLQACISDWEFLRSRATLNGFQLFVRNGTLHFHPIEVRETEVSLQLFGRNANINRFDVTIDRFQSAPTFEATKVNPLTGSVIAVRSGFQPDDLFSSEASARFSNRVRNAQSLSGGPRRFHYPVQSQINADSIAAEIQAAADAGRFVVMAETATRAVEFLRPSDSVTIRGIRRFNGKYIIRWIRFMIRPRGGFRMELGLRRTFTGETKEQGEKRDATSQSTVSTVVVDGESIELGSTDPVTGNRAQPALNFAQLSKLRQAKLIPSSSIAVREQEGKLTGIDTTRTLNQAQIGAPTISAGSVAAQSQATRDKSEREKRKVQFFEAVSEERPIKDFREKSLEDT